MSIIPDNNGPDQQVYLIIVMLIGWASHLITYQKVIQENEMNINYSFSAGRGSCNYQGRKLTRLLEGILHQICAGLF